MNEFKLILRQTFETVFAAAAPVAGLRPEAVPSRVGRLGLWDDTESWILETLKAARDINRVSGPEAARRYLRTELESVGRRIGEAIRLRA